MDVIVPEIPDSYDEYRRRLRAADCRSTPHAGMEAANRTACPRTGR